MVPWTTGKPQSSLNLHLWPFDLSLKYLVHRKKNHEKLDMDNRPPSYKHFNIMQIVSSMNEFVKGACNLDVHGHYTSILHFFSMKGFNFVIN
jgi:hypothetical protein